MKRYPWAAVLFVLGAVAIAYLPISHGPVAGRTPFDNTQGRRPGDDPAVAVKLSAAEQGPISYVLTARGPLLPAAETTVVSPMAGRVELISVAAGERVAAGQTVATLDRTGQRRRVAEEEAAVGAAEAMLREREAQFADAEKQVENARAFRLKDFISTQELESAETKARATGAERDLALAQLAQKQATLAQSRYLLSLAVVVAPFDGVVVRRLVEPGAVVAPATPILTLYGKGNRTMALKIAVSIPERDASLARVGMAATLDGIDALPGRAFDGKVARLHSFDRAQDRPLSPPDSSGRALVAEVHAADPQQLLKPGMLARVSLVLGEHREAVLIPSEAIVEEEEGEQGKFFVFAVADGRAKKIAVTTGWSQNGLTEIVNGLAAGEKIIVSGQQRLSPGISVRVSE